ncbi:MAG: hypothetical protein ACOCQF_03285 [Halanaerobiaceae bacterium]
MEKSKAKGRKLLKILITLAFLIVLLVILNFALGSIIARNFREGVQESLGEDIYLTRGSFSANPALRTLEGEGIEVYGRTGRMAAEELDISMSFLDMLGLARGKHIDDDFLNTKNLKLSLFELSFEDNQQNLLLAIEQLDLDYTGNANLAEEHLDFQAGVRINQADLNPVRSKIIDKGEADEIQSMVGIDVEDLDLVNIEMKASSQDFFPAGMDERYEFKIDQLDFETSYLDLFSRFELAYHLEPEEIEIYESRIEIEFASQELRQGIQFFAMISGVQLNFENDRLIFEPEGRY